MNNVLWIRGYSVYGLPEQFDALRLCISCSRPAYQHVCGCCLYTPNKPMYMTVTYLVVGDSTFILGNIDSPRHRYISSNYASYHGKIDEIPESLNIDFIGLYVP